LCRYTPPVELQALEEIIASYRPKVKSLARKVKRRFVVYLDLQKSPILPLPVAITQPPTFDLSGALQDIDQIMQQALGNGELQHQLLVQIKGALRYHCRQMPDLEAETGDLGDFSSGEKSPNEGETGDSSHSTEKQKSPTSLQKGNFLYKRAIPLCKKATLLLNRFLTLTLYYVII
jgi:hypothetical protein